MILILLYQVNNLLCIGTNPAKPRSSEDGAYSIINNTQRMVYYDGQYRAKSLLKVTYHFDESI